jgi:conjugative relaxase-like TrwC/TraI family protein
MPGQDDYYVRPDEEKAGVWIGGASEKFSERYGLQETVTKKQFGALFDGYSPDGKKEPLVQNAGKMTPRRDENGKVINKDEPLRQPGWDLTFSAPKSVSILHAITTDRALKAALERAHLEAIKTTFERIESETFTRIGKGGKERVDAKLLAAVFQHDTARPTKGEMPDPQLHSHMVVINVCTNSVDDKTRSIWSKRFYEQEHRYGAMYRAELSKNVEGLGFTTYRTGEFFEVKGVPEALIKELSKRGKEIKKAARDESAEEREKAALRIRQKKEEYTKDQLLEHWTRAARRHGLAPEKIKELRHSYRQERSLSIESREAVKGALEAVIAKAPHFTEKDLERVTNVLAQGRGIGTHAATDVVREYLASDAVNIVGTHKGEKVFTTKADYQKSREEYREASRQEEREKNFVIRKSDYEAVREDYRGSKFIAVTSDRPAADRLQKNIGMQAASVRILLNEMEGRRFRKQRALRRMIKLDFSKKIEEVDTKKEERRRLSRRIGAEVKFALGMISAKTRKKVTGDYWKPRHEAAHKFLWATGQISKKQMRHLDAELRHKRLEVTKGTVVIIDSSIRHHPRMADLVREVEKREGKIVFAGERMKEKESQRQKEWESREVVKEVKNRINHAEREELQKKYDEERPQEKQGMKIKLRHELK